MSNQVSWQSAFWALVPIALNSMCQPCGKIFGLPSKYGFYLSSSPIVCVVNALELVFKLLWRFGSTRSAVAAANLTADEIFEDVESSGRPDGLAQLQEIWQVRVIIFACGMPQFIKLYAMAGIPRTKTCASLYFSSFLTIEFIMIWLKCYRLSPSSKRQNNRKNHFSPYEFFRTFAMFITISSSSVAFIGTAFKLATGSNLSHTSLLVNWAIWGFGIHFLVGRSSKKSGLESWHSVFYLCLLTFTIFGGILYIMPVDWTTIKLFDNVFRLDGEGGPRKAVFLFVPFLAFLFYFSYLTHFLGTREAFRESPKIQHCAFIAFMLLHLLAAIFLYIFKYDPQGTYKPDWTNNLG